MPLIDSMLNIGLADHQKDETTEQTRVVNAIASLTAVLVLVYGIVFYLVWPDLGILLPAICFCVAFCAVLYANHRHYYRAAKLGLQCTFAFVILYYGAYLGRIANTQLLAVFMVSLSLLIFSWEERLLCIISILLPLAGLVLLEMNEYYGWITPLKLGDAAQYIYRWLIMIVVIALNFLVIYFYQRRFHRLLMHVKQQRETLAEMVKERTMELQNTVSQLDRSNASKTVFLQETSHEIRNALHAISGITQLLRHAQQQRQASGEEQLLIENLYSTSNALSEIINNVLELSRIEAGKTDELHEACFPLREWLQGIVNIYAYTTRLKKINLQLKTDPAVPPFVIIDRIRLRQVINNLLTNAIKYTPAFRNITLRCFVKEGSLCIQVQDEGVGIAADKLDDIFKPFEQGALPTYGSSGLGLTIAHRMSEMLGGHIGIESVQGQGTTITVTLPLKEGNAAMVEEFTPDLRMQPVLQDARILIMEDDPLNQVIMRRMLQQMGVHDVMIAGDGEEGLAQAQAMPPDLIIMDMQMPRMAGEKVVQRIRQDAYLRHIPVLATSANAFAEQRQKALESGIDEYLTKPVAYDTLYQLLKKHLLETAYS